MHRIKSVAMFLVLWHRVKSGKTRRRMLDPDQFYRDNIVSRQNEKWHNINNTKNEHMRMVCFEGTEMSLKSLLDECDFGLQTLLREYYCCENKVVLPKFDYNFWWYRSVRLSDININKYFLLRFILEGNLYFLKKLLDLYAFLLPLSFTHFFSMYGLCACIKGCRCGYKICLYTEDRHFYYCVVYASNYVNFVLPHAFYDDIYESSRFDRCADYHINNMLSIDPLLVAQMFLNLAARNINLQYCYYDMVYDKMGWSKRVLDEWRAKHNVSKLFFELDGHYVVLEDAALVKAIETLPCNSKTLKYLSYTVHKKKIHLANKKHKTCILKSNQILFTRLTYANLLLLACNEFLHEFVVAMLNYQRNVLSNYKDYREMSVRIIFIERPVLKCRRSRFILFCKRVYPFCHSEQQKASIVKACEAAGVDVNSVTKTDLVPFANKIGVWWLHHMYKPTGKQMVVIQHRFEKLYQATCKTLLNK
ncbi:cyun31 [Cyclophragma undans nucleopolyhedrovirus]|uniref:Cyun31 n=1 Tax=Cyclophragma undans nucleopolyhedrovirus TaxID=1906244 RepID=A0A288QB14_9ABAC|nr:cyun31 [Cyclophragma undans nucleopolyhedrovirus]AOT85501.1 cyun31 [Cyclophragma undans nucleopolyhedrovirus]